MNDALTQPIGHLATYARMVADHVRALDLDHTPVLDALGLASTHTDADLASHWVSATQLAEALRLAAKLCHDPHIGLSIGQKMRPANMGQLGYAVISSADMQEGLALFERLQTLVCSVVRVEHRIKGELIESHFEAVGEVPRDTHYWTFNLVARLAFARWVSGRHLVPLHTWMPCPAPADPQPLLDYYGGPISFDAPNAKERVPANWLQLPNPNADAAVHELMSAATSRQWAQQGRDQPALLGHLRQHIANRLQTGELPLLDALSADVEAALGLSARQLQRRLAEQGLAFKDVLEDVRRTQVLHELRHTSLPLADVARRAAYAEVSSMHRAVRRWTGQTPLAVREGRATG